MQGHLPRQVIDHPFRPAIARSGQAQISAPVRHQCPHSLETTLQQDCRL
jgi:hypothetical protein